MTEETGAAAPVDAQPQSSVAGSEQATPTHEQPNQAAADENAQTGEEGLEQSDTTGDSGADERKRQSRNERYKRKISAQAGMIDRVATENQSLRAEIENLKKSQSAEKAPNPADYEQGEWDPKFIAKVAAFEAKKELRAELEARHRSDAEMRQSESARAEKARVDQFAAKAAQLIPDFNTKINAFVEEIGPENIPQHVSAALGAIGESGAYIAYQLASNPDLADELFSMPPEQAFIKIGELKAKVSVPNPKKQTSAPPPLNTPKGGASAPVDLRSLAKNPDATAYIKARNQQEKARA